MLLMTLILCILKQASEKPNDENLRSHIGNIELTRSQEPVVHTISKIAHEVIPSLSFSSPLAFKKCINLPPSVVVSGS